MRVSFCVAAATLMFSVAGLAQHRVNPTQLYHRVIAVVPLQGKGSPEDPIRPKHAPAHQGSGPSRSGIIAFSFQPSDDGKYAIAEFVAVDRKALAGILADHQAGVLAFEKGVAKAADIEAAIRPFRKGFSLSNFGVPVQ